jgi:hypothetical protein
VTAVSSIEVDGITIELLVAASSRLPALGRREPPAAMIYRGPFCESGDGQLTEDEP